MSTNRREFIRNSSLGLAGLYIGSSFSTALAADSAVAGGAKLADQIAAIGRRLASAGWRDLFLKVTGGQIDLGAATLAKDLETEIKNIDRSVPGFEDFADEGRRLIQAGQPARSLLYHALASANVLEDGAGQPLRDFPTLAEIETVENGVYGLRPPSIADLRAQATEKDEKTGQTRALPLAIVVFSSEYRSARHTVHRKHADLCFARTATARTGNAPALYDAKSRDFAALVEPVDATDSTGNKFKFRVLPTRFVAYVAVQRRGNRASFGPMRFQEGDGKRNFWVPLQKLFAGSECIQGLTLGVSYESHFINEKLRKLHEFMEEGGFGGNSKPEDRENFPFVIRDAKIAAFASGAEHGNGVIAPTVNPIFQMATYKDQPLGFKVSGKFARGGGNTWFSSLQIVADAGDSVFKDEIAYQDGLNTDLGRTAPEYINARHKQLEKGGIENLNDSPDLMEILLKGGYKAQHYIDFTGDGWVEAACPQLAKEFPTKVAAYVGIAPPDFFPALSQGEMMEWWERDAPFPIRKGVWCIEPLALSDARMAANITLKEAGFAIGDDTVTAIVSQSTSGDVAQRPLNGGRRGMIARLPDGSNGVFDPGWDFSQDVKQTINGRKHYLTNYGLGTPFIEDAKLCAALGSFWPAVAPDATRVFQPGKRPQGDYWPWPAIVPLTDEEIGTAPYDGKNLLPWDGVPGPSRIGSGDLAKYKLTAGDWMRYADIAHVDYIDIPGTLTAYLTSRIDLKEYESRILATASAYWALGITEKKFFKADDYKVGPDHNQSFTTDQTRSMAANRMQLEKAKWAVASFRKVASTETELLAAGRKTQTKIAGSGWYRILIYRYGRQLTDPTNFKHVLVEMHDVTLFYVNPETVLFQPEGEAWAKQTPFET